MESITGKVLRTFPQDTNTDEIIQVNTSMMNSI